MEVILHEVKSEPTPTQIIVPDLDTSSSPDRSPNKNNNLQNLCRPRNPSSTLPTHKISTIQSVSSASSAIVPNSTPVRITTLSEQQLQTMAKSSGLSVVHVSVPQSVIQSPSVIQSASGQLQLSKNVILVSSKANSSVIQTASGGIQTVQVLEAHHSDESLSNDGVDPPDNRTADKRRREILTRRPSYRKILNDLGGAEISGEKLDSATTSESSQEGNSSIVLGNQYPVKVLNTNALGINQTPVAGTSVPTALQTITMTNAGAAGGTIVQYAQAQDGQFFVPVTGGMSGHTGTGEEVTRKREIRLLKNREAARECRRKKKEYIKCLENRVAVLENQNKALIDELKSLKELYCQQKND